MNFLKNILTVSVVSCILALHPSLNKGNNPITYLQYLVYGNSFHLDLSPSIHKSLVSVWWQHHSESPILIYEQGKKINDIPFEKGPQKLIVYYQNQK